MRPTKTQISQRIHTVWSESPLSAWRNVASLIVQNITIHAYSNILKISPPKTGSFQIEILIFFHISAQNIDCGYSLEPPRRGGSYEYPQSMFFSRNKKNNVYPYKPQFYYIKVGFNGVKLYRRVFVMSAQGRFDQNVWMRKLIWIFDWRTCSKVHFLIMRLSL